MAWALIAATGINPYLANGLGAVSAISVSFAGNSQITFVYEGSISQAFTRFLVQSAIAFAMTSFIVFLVERNRWSDWAYALIVIGTVPPTTFVISKYWVFRLREESDREL